MGAFLVRTHTRLFKRPTHSPRASEKEKDGRPRKKKNEINETGENVSSLHHGRRPLGRLLFGVELRVAPFNGALFCCCPTFFHVAIQFLSSIHEHSYKYIFVAPFHGVHPWLPGRWGRLNSLILRDDYLSGAVLEHLMHVTYETRKSTSSIKTGFIISALDPLVTPTGKRTDRILGIRHSWFSIPPPHTESRWYFFINKTNQLKINRIQSDQSARII